MDEDEGWMERARVRCLSDVVGLQRACQSASLRFSAETNKFLVYDTLQKLGLSAAQKLVSKLVDDGFIKWEDDEEYEVEDILDHADEDGKRYYLIKWIGWSQFHNSWEPAENLECPGVISDYLASIEKSKTHLSIKRSLPKMSESAQISKRRKVDEIFHKLWCSPMSEDMTPLQLLTMHRNQVKPNGNAKQVVHKGLVSSHDRTMRPKFSTTAPDYSNKKKKVYKQKKAEIQLALKDWEKRLNTVNSDPAPIAVQNDIDLEGPPENFVYINDYRAGEGIEIPQDPIIGCECECCFDEKKTCCGAACGSEFAYYRGKRLRVPRGTPIYECNKRCKCGPECPNRVVQEGRKFKVCIFRTSNSRGWGVKTLQKIKRGSFVMEYVGEVITNEEAERRGKVYDAECRTYLFDLDYNDGDCPFTVDAGYYGNVSHFVNHSCEPNLVVYGVWINTLDPRLPRICLFADRDIEKGEELTFDYMMTGDTTQPQQNLGFAAQLSPGRESTDTVIGTLSSADSEGTLSQGTSQTDLSESPEIPSSSETYDTPPSSPSKGRRDASSSPSKGQEHIPSSPSKNLRASQVSPSKGHKTVPDSPSKGHKTALSNETEMVPKSPLKENETAPTSPSKGQKTIPASPSKRDKIVPASPLKGDTSVPTSSFKGDKKGSSSPSKTQKEPPSFSPEKLQSPPVLPPKFSLPSPNEDMSSDKSLPVSAKSPGAVSSDEKKTPGQAKKKYRMICQCGSAKCRKYLF